LGSRFPKQRRRTTDLDRNRRVGVIGVIDGPGVNIDVRRLAIQGIGQPACRSVRRQNRDDARSAVSGAADHEGLEVVGQDAVQRLGVAGGLAGGS
jgi:hypothetical protein